MQFRLRSIDVTAAGREIVRERELAAESIVIGRDAANAIHLPDLAVEQQHIRLTPAPGGTLRAEALGSLGFTLDGRNVQSGAIDPAKGAEIGVGSYRLDFSTGEDGATVITTRQRAEDEGGGKERLRGFTLASALPGKRTMAWAGSIVILLAFLAIPIFSHLTREQVEPQLTGEGVVLMDASWSTGALSSVHHGLENNCEACHVEPFVAVRDQTCLTCHEGIADHALADRMSTGRPQAEGGEALLWSVAHAFNKPGPGACTDCHTEHEGAGRMEPTRQQFCADCHDTLDSRLSYTTLGNAADFGEAHPEFKVAVLAEQGASERRRLSLASHPKDWNGLRFPHDIHLDPTSGVTQMARRLGADAGYGDGLECASCHTPTADGVRFLPVDMETNCETCHSLVYDRVGSTFRTLRHGDVAQVEADLLAADRSPRRPVMTGRRRPGDYAEGGIYYGNFSRVAPSVLRASAMDSDGLCGECHLPGDAATGVLSVAPVRQHARFMMNGWFDHDAHTQEDCATCHAADTSNAASDLLLPDLASCRDCHEGEAALSAEVPSSCAMCHSYHPREGAAAAPPRIAGLSGARIKP
ncbi:cytochrome c3 family protein [Alteraurantiacibacter aquimixticola]|uniref:Cytochrome C n=1 Tax=Alteraurantiacibacter aquimixticola TaxID=2489173 RepID=A0A4T3F1D4_9SPHN|nr:cytochrome c3 family protein [Alteraurantiacibacter aquimixticola]TIX50993.1 cytochrome C [Alteraurantiacibacter aquimixticola]